MTRSELIRLLQSTAASQETLHHVAHIWKDQETPDLPDFNSIIEQCCQAVGTNVEAAKSKDRHTINVRARGLFIYWINTYHSNACTLGEMGSFLGGRDHTTVIHSRDEFMKLIDVQDETAIRDLENLRRVVNGLKPRYFVPAAKILNQPPKFVKLFYERRVDRYYRNIKSIRIFYGMHKSAYINRMRFTQKIVSPKIFSEIDLVDV